MLRETGPTLAGRRLERAGWRAPDVRLRGRRLVHGRLSFVPACGVGSWANVGIAACLAGRQVGRLTSALAGVAVGVVSNHATTSVDTWRG